MKHNIKEIKNVSTVTTMNGNIVKLFESGLNEIAKQSKFFNSDIVFQNETLLILSIKDHVAAKELGPYWALEHPSFFEGYVTKWNGKQFYIYDIDAEKIEDIFFGVTLHPESNKTNNFKKTIAFDLKMKDRADDVQKMEWFKHLQA